MDQPNLNRGIQLFEIGRYKDAIPYFQKGLTEDINGFNAKYYLAQCFFQTDNTDKALVLAKELRKDFPNIENTYFLLSQIYLHTDNVKEASLNIDKAIELNPYEESFFGQKAYIYLAQKQFQKALEYANEGLKIDAKSSFCLNARTTALTKLNRKEEAKSAINYLLNDNPEDAYSHANAGWSHLENNNITKAATHFKEALILDPNLEIARNGMVTTIKSRNKIYNLYLRYVFWIANKSEKNQWFFIIGIYLIYRFSVKLLSANGLTFIAIPIIILYLLFALGSWIMDPLSNMLLIFDKYGKYLLDKKEKLSGQVFFLILATALVMLIGYLITNIDYFTIICLTLLATILPFTRGILASKKTSSIINISYGAIMLCVTIVGCFLSLPISSFGIIIAFMFIAYTWLGGLITK